MSSGNDPLAAIGANVAEEVRRKLELDEVRRALKPGQSREQKLKEACDGFEAIFLNKLWQQMRKTVDKDGYLHSKEEESYVGMFDHEMSLKMAEAGGMGLGDQLFSQLKERLAMAGSHTPSLARARGEGVGLPLNPEDTRDLKLRPEAAELKVPPRPGSARDQAAILAAELAQRIVSDHQDRGGDALDSDMSPESLAALLDEEASADLSGPGTSLAEDAE